MNRFSCRVLSLSKFDKIVLLRLKNYLKNGIHVIEHFDLGYVSKLDMQVPHDFPEVNRKERVDMSAFCTHAQIKTFWTS